MYSVVLATMLTAGASSTTFCHRSWCHGCGGCHYNAFSSCHCNGCFCNGCHSFCSGCYCNGCSCSGWCSGCSCSGWCNGRSWCHGCNGGVIVVNGCNGCHCSGGAVHASSGPSNEAERKAVEELLQRIREEAQKRLDDKKRERKKQREDGDQQAETASPARVVVKVPATARLWVDQVPCPLEGTERSFATPALTPGQRYFYTLRVEVNRDGRRVEESRRVPLVAGQRVEVDFSNVGAVRTAAN